MHTEGGFRAKSAIFADFNEARGVHTGTGKKETKSKNHDFIEKKQEYRRDRQENRVTLVWKQDGIVIKA